jgi:Tfp pilus assembly protein PilN
MTSANVRHLNFLDEKASGPKKLFSLNYLWIIIILLICIAISSGYSLFQRKRIANMRDQIDSITEEIAEIQAIQMQRQQATLSASTRKNVLSNPILWSDLLRKMAKKIPESVKLIQITGGITGKRTLVLKGVSPLLLPIYRLKDNFLEMPECANATLVSIEQAQAANGEGQLSFQLECTLT